MQALINRMYSYGRDLQSELSLTELTEKEIYEGLLNIDIDDLKHSEVHSLLEKKFHN